LKKRADDLGVRSVLIMIDNEGQIGAADEARRIQTVENHTKWVEMAKALGCHSIRVNAQSSGNYEEQQKLAADGLRRLTEFGKQHEINVIVENHGGLSSNGQWLSGVMKIVNDPHCGTLPDFGNFRVSGTETYDRYKGIEELIPFAKGLSAKTYDFDDAGNETTIDVKRIIKIAMAANYHGYVGIEYEGRRIPLKEGVRKTKALLERVRDELAKESA
jgi:sugar phosphate isomerase/epimerase